MKVPIACTLTSGEAGNRIGEWRTAMNSSVTAAVRTAPSRLELHVANGPEAAGRLVDLARREKACCGFFGFTVEIGADRAVMVVTVPDAASAVLDDLATLRGPQPG